MRRILGIVVGAAMVAAGLAGADVAAANQRVAENYGIARLQNLKD